MTQRTRIGGALGVLALAGFLATSVPGHAESWYDPRPTAPVGVHTAPTVDHWGRTVIVTDGPVVVRPRPESARHPVFLPVKCLQRFAIGHDSIRLFEAECLVHEGISMRHLPERCTVSVRAPGYALRGYDPHCLRDAGYRMAGD